MRLVCDGDGAGDLCSRCGCGCVGGGGSFDAFGVEVMGGGMVVCMRGGGIKGGRSCVEVWKEVWWVGNCFLFGGWRGEGVGSGRAVGGGVLMLDVDE